MSNINMEWCIENTLDNSLLQILMGETGEEVRTIIFNSPEQAEDFIKEFNWNMDTGIIVQRIIFGPKIPAEAAAIELRKEKDNNVKSKN